MSTARPQLAVVAAEAPGSSDGSATHTRDRLARRSACLDSQRPEVLDLEAELLDLLADQLRGSAGVFADGSPVHYREALRGERHVHLSDLCRLACSRRPEAHRALASALSRLQAQLEETAGLSVDDLHELIAGFAQQTADVTAAGTRALKDGEVDESEDLRLSREIAEAEVAIAQLKEGLSKHRRARRSRKAAFGREARS